MQVLFTAMFAVLLLAPAVLSSGGPRVWFGEGCFWERQYAYVMVELNVTGPFKRSNTSVTRLPTSIVGYAGARSIGDDGLVCYDTGTSNDYGTLGFCEAVSVQLDADKEAEQFTALVDDFLGSFTPTDEGFVRPDLPPLLPYGDVGAPYRTVLGIPGGIRGSFFKILAGRNVPRGPFNMTMDLKEDSAGNMTQDSLNTVWVMDSTVFPFYNAEQYHQYHSNFFHNPHHPQQYPDWYLNDLFELQRKHGNIPNTGCPDSSCPTDANGNCHW